MQVVLPEIDEFLASIVEDIGVPDVPLLRDRPIQDLGTGRDFVYRERDMLLDDPQCFTNPVAGDAPADGK